VSNGGLSAREIRKFIRPSDIAIGSLPVLMGRQMSLRSADFPREFRTDSRSAARPAATYGLSKGARWFFIRYD
jgi:hypothetical protein